MIDCPHKDICKCNENFTTSFARKRCDDCQFYRWIDSGYGHCLNLSEPNNVVAWCKETCNLFKDKTRWDKN